jgi:hypothetical protein
MDLDGAPYGGARYPVEAIMADRTFAKFHLDVGVGDIIVDPTEIAHTHNWLGFAAIDAPRVPMIQREQQFAEKIHAYTLPRQGAPNSRVRDLVDLTLLIRSGTLDSDRVIQSLRQTFERRNTHAIPRALDQPPTSWTAPFAAMARECSLAVTCEAAFTEVAAFFVKLQINE